jgi:hypothetical protein
MYKQTVPAENCFTSAPSGGIVMIKPDSSDFTPFGDYCQVFLYIF